MDGPMTAFRAPWSRLLILISWGAGGLLTAIAVLEAVAIPRHLLGGWPWLAATGVPLLIVVGCALFVVRGYALSPGTLHVQRLLWRTRIPLDGLHAAWASPDAMAGSIRLFGNGGLFSFTGLFRNRTLGKYRSFATEPRLAVVLELPQRKVVVTPESPQLFLEHLELVAPGAVRRSG